MEPTEIDEFRKQVIEGGDASLKHVSLAISILAVLVAMVTVLGHRTHTEAVLLQSRAADQWNEYQARKIRQTEYIIATDQLSLQAGTISDAAARKMAEYKAHIEETAATLPEQQKKARELEDEVRHAERAASRYDLGEALLQIAVVLTSITLLTRRSLYFFVGLGLGVAGLLAAASVLLLHS